MLTIVNIGKIEGISISIGNSKLTVTQVSVSTNNIYLIKTNKGIFTINRDYSTLVFNGKHCKIPERSLTTPFRLTMFLLQQYIELKKHR